MQNYKRKISYFYQYHNGMVGSTAGFLKMEIRGEKVKMIINIQDPSGIQSGEASLYLYHEAGEKLIAVRVDVVPNLEGVLTYQKKMEWMNLFDTGRDLYTFDGVAVVYHTSHYFIGDFQDRSRKNYELVLQEPERPKKRETVTVREATEADRVREIAGRYRNPQAAAPVHDQQEKEKPHDDQAATEEVDRRGEKKPVGNGEPGWGGSAAPERIENDRRGHTESIASEFHREREETRGETGQREKEETAADREGEETWKTEREASDWEKERLKWKGKTEQAENGVLPSQMQQDTERKLETQDREKHWDRSEMESAEGKVCEIEDGSVVTGENNGETEGVPQKASNEKPGIGRTVVESGEAERAAEKAADEKTGRKAMESGGIESAAEKAAGGKAKTGNMPEKTADEKCEAGGAGRSKPEKCEKCPYYQRQMAEKENGDAFETMLREYPRLPMYNASELFDCVRIVPRDIGRLDMRNWKLGVNSFLTHGYYSYHYLLLGRMRFDDGSSRSIIGVPGVFSNREKYLANMFGFDQFIPVKKTGIKTGEFGYWIVEISPSL